MVVACRVKSDVGASITNVSEYSSGHAHICHSVGLGLTVHVAIHIIIIIITTICKVLYHISRHYKGAYCVTLNLLVYLLVSVYSSHCFLWSDNLMQYKYTTKYIFISHCHLSIILVCFGIFCLYLCVEVFQSL